MTEPAVPPGRAALFGLIAVVGSGLLATAAIEVALRITDRPFKGTSAFSEEAIAGFDPGTGWSYLPNKTAVQKFGSEQYEVTMHFDAQGTRVQTRGATRSADRPTVLIVGGSFAMGHGVTYEQSIAGHMERLVPDRQIVNAAVQGFGTDQSLVMLRRALDRYDTKAVVYGFICDHVRRNEWEDRRILLPAQRFPGTKPAFHLGASGLEQTHWPVRAEDLSYSHLYAYARVAYAHYGPPPSFELTRALIREMDREARARGATFAVVDWEIRGTPELCQTDPLKDLGVDVIRPAANAPEGWPTWFIPGDFHPNPQSHAYVAKLVAAHLRAP